MPPTIFTQTPIEAHILALFMRAQVSFASFMSGQGAFRTLAWGVLAIVICLEFWRMAQNKDYAGQAIGKIVYRTVLIFVAFALLGGGGQTGFSSATGPWGNRTSIQSSAKFAQTAGGTSEGLRWYLMVYQALNGLAQSMVASIADTFNDSSLARDPTFFAKQMARMGALSLGADAAAAFDGLLQDCSVSDAGKVVGNFSRVEDLFNLSTDECRRRWSNFSSVMNAEGDRLRERYQDHVWMGMETEVARLFGSQTGDAGLALKNIATAHALARHVSDRAGFSSDWNRSANRAATFSDTTDGVVEDAGTGVLWNLGVMNLLDRFSDGNARAVAQKAEAANKFNAISALIPAARAFLQGILALLFVVAAYTLAFGTWKFLYAWLMAMGALCLYSPVAVLGFKVCEYFTTGSKIMEAMARTSQDPLIVGGSKIIQGEMARIQTVYLCFEIGTFAVFALGAVACFRPVASLANTLGATIGASAGSAAMSAMHMGHWFARGAAGAQAMGGAQSLQVNLNGRPVAGVGGEGAGQLAQAQGGAGRGWTGKGGLVTPSAQPPKTWKEAS